MDTGKALRVVQVALVLGALLTGLGWFEEDRSSATHELGEGSLQIRTSAPVENPRGPWQEGDVFTDGHAGVPLDVAPTLNVTATHRTDGLSAEDATWNATLRVEATGDEGGVWWRQARSIAVETEDDATRLSIDLPATIREAREMADEAGVPSRLTIEIDVRHQATVTVDGDPRPSDLVATVELVPREGFVVVQTRDDASTYSRPVDAGIDPLPPVLLGAAILAEGAIRFARRDDAPWESVRGVRVLAVEDLEEPSDSHRVSFEDIASAARDENRPLLVDPTTGIAVLDGASPLTAPLPGQR